MNNKENKNDANRVQILVAIISAIAVVLAALIPIVLQAKASITAKFDELPAWKEVYKNDQHGNQEFGQIEWLARAVTNGLPVRVVWSRKLNSYVAHPAEHIFVDKPNGQYRVTAVFDEPAWGLDTNGEYTIKSPPTFLENVVSTTGRFYVHSFQLYQTNENEKPTGTIEASWFVQVSTTRLNDLKNAASGK